MLLSINWLKDFLQKPDVKINIKTLAHEMAMLGLPISNIKNPSASLEKVVVGKIVKIEKHPNADRLQVTDVIFSETDPTPTKIVCGAKNISEGDVVAVARPGCILPGDFEIKVSTIRGVESSGMICSSKELGLPEEGEGILQLPKSSVLGESVSKLLGKDDCILEFELTPNRSDCLSIMGLARELAPVIKTQVKEPKPFLFKNSPHKTSSIIKIEVADPNLCPRYIGRIIDGLKVEESSDWVKQRLLSVDQKPINNIVDITNYVMLETGQPLHAFDLRKIHSGSIKVDACKEPMPMTLLNGQTVQLEVGDILILDGDRPIALAGIMGGLNSQIEPDTSSILLESASFNPDQIRKTAKRLGLLSDASKRFEKGVDIEGVQFASDRASGLLREHYKGNVYHPPIDTNEAAYEEKILSIDMREVRDISGLQNITTEFASDLLDSIGIISEKKSQNILQVKLPPWRLDLKESIDIIEEITRLNGYERIPETYPLSLASYQKMDESDFNLNFKVKKLLSDLGFRETIHYSFVSENLLKRFYCDNENSVHLQNPISDEMKVLRTSLLPSLLQTFQNNSNRNLSTMQIFEVAKIFHKDENEETSISENSTVSGLISGPVFYGPLWKKQEVQPDFYYLKGIIETLISKLTSVKVNYESLSNHKLFHPKKSAVIKLGLKEIGILGEVHPLIRESILATEETVLIFELNLELLKRYIKTTIRYKNPSEFPGIELDLALVVDKTISNYNLLEGIKYAGGPLLASVNVFDVYEGSNIPESKKSMAFRLFFSSNEKTLEDKDVKPIQENILKILSEKFSAQLRA